MKKNKFKLSPLLIIVALALLFFSSFKNFVIYFIVICLHEFAHYFIAKKLGYKLKNMYIMPYGVCLSYNDTLFSEKDEIYIAIAGPVINIIFCLLCVTLWWLFPETYYYLDYFCFCNLMLATFNLIPCFPLDGGRVLVGLLSSKIDREKALKVTIIINYIVSIVLLVLFFVSILKDINFTYLFVAIFLFSGTINLNNFSSYTNLSAGLNKNKLLKRGSSVKIFAVNEFMPLYKICAKFSKYKYNVIYVVFENGAVKVLSENNIQNMLLKHSPAMSVAEIIALSALK